MKGGFEMDCKIIKKPAFTVIGSTKVIKNEEGYKECPQFWTEHYEILCLCRFNNEIGGLLPSRNPRDQQHPSRYPFPCTDAAYWRSAGSRLRGQDPFHVSGESPANAQECQTCI